MKNVLKLIILFPLISPLYAGGQCVKKFVCYHDCGTANDGTYFPQVSGYFYLSPDNEYSCFWGALPNIDCTSSFYQYGEGYKYCSHHSSPLIGTDASVQGSSTSGYTCNGSDTTPTNTIVQEIQRHCSS